MELNQLGGSQYCIIMQTTTTYCVIAPKSNLKNSKFQNHDFSDFSLHGISTIALKQLDIHTTLYNVDSIYEYNIGLASVFA